MIIQLALCDDAPAHAPTFEERAVVFVERRTRVTVRSCATNHGWEMVDIVHRTIVAHPRPYRLQRGERYVARSALTEAAKHAALHVLSKVTQK